MTRPGSPSEQAVTAELLTMEQRGVSLRFSLTPAEGLLLLGQLQVALQVPANNGYGRKSAERIARDLQDRLAGAGASEQLKNVMELGWQTKGAPQS